jgi:sodium/potassium-transporting ATPase subunit alpha
VETTCNELSALGERVLAVAVRELRRDEIGEASFERLMRGAASPSDVCGERLGGLTLLGLVSLFDPPRPQAARAVSEARDAGIRVFLVTGDHPRTAEAVARQVGILGRHPTWRELAREHSLSESQVLGDKRLSAAVKAAVVTGAELDAMSDAEWSRVLRMEELVFARATPHHKLAIVNQCRRRGLVVAVTGDGVNDAPALKVADVGVAMGRVGADVCRVR